MSATTNGQKIKFPLLLAQLCLQQRDSVWEGLWGGLAVLQPCTGTRRAACSQHHSRTRCTDLAPQGNITGDPQSLFPGFDGISAPKPCRHWERPFFSSSPKLIQVSVLQQSLWEEDGAKHRAPLGRKAQQNLLCHQQHLAEVP